MEKKTIGKFIAVLRKANGMTQKDLGDRLFVSDKTVSRWERDECDPELSLIPAIAEIFGITTDELLRGERNSPEAPVAEEIKPSTKSEKQFKTMLRARVRKYKNLSFISIGLLAVGLIATIISSTIPFGNFISLIATIASTVCQIAFASNYILPLDEDDFSNSEKVLQTNSKITRIAIVFVYAAIAVLSCCLLIEFDLYLTLIPIILAICVLPYFLFIKPMLIKHNLLYFTEEQCRKIKFRRKILGKVTCIGGSSLVLLIAALIVVSEIGIMGFVKEEVYETFEEFGSAMLEDHKEYIEFLREFKSFVIYDDGHLVNMESEIPDDHRLVHKTVTDFEGNVVFEYDYNTDLYFDIRFSFRNDRLPVTVVTNDSYRNAKGIYNSIIYSALIAAAIDIAACAAIYFISAYGKKSKKI